jgi:glucose-6-phosphate isomerase
MQLPDEAISYQYQSLLVPPGEEWTAAAELRSKHFIHPSRLKEAVRRVEQAKSQVAVERELRNVPAEALPFDSGFIDLPQVLLDGLRRKGEQSDLARIMASAERLREQAGTVVLLGAGGDGLGARVLFEALCSAHHNELPTEVRMGMPRLHFAGDSFDNDALQELRELIEVTCVDPGLRDERWGVLVISRSGTTLETQTALRVFRRDANEYYGLHSEWLRWMFVPVTGSSGPLREIFRAEGYTDDEILTIPDNVGSRFSVFSAAGLLPAALVGLDVRALLQGAAAMTRRFLDEPFDRNPVLQLAAVNHLMLEEQGKPIRVLSIWSKKLAALGQWYDQLVATSLGKQGRGPTPMSLVQTRDLYARGQLHQEGPRDRFTNNLIVRTPQKGPVAVQMAERNEDGLNAFNRKTLPDLTLATMQGANRAHADVARPTADLVVPSLSEHTMGQLLQMLMLATVLEGRLLGINPYSETASEIVKKNTLQSLKG